jgi:outer membrane protein TolC
MIPIDLALAKGTQGTSVMKKVKRSVLNAILFGLCVLISGGVGCSPAKYRQHADREVEAIIHQKQLETKGQAEPFTIETPADTLRRRLLVDQTLPYAGDASLGSDVLPAIEDWPEEDQPSRAKASEPLLPPWNGDQPLKLTLMDTLMVAAANSREYQTTKEDIFQVALGLDLERNAFRNIFFGSMESGVVSDHSGDQAISGVANNASATWTRLLKSGAALSSRIFIDLVKLLTQGRSSSFGIFADATISIPLMAGSGRNIVTEPLVQAERDVVYSIYTFDRFKRTLAVRIASGYLAVLKQMDVLKNAEENYHRLKSGAQRATRLAEAGRLPRIQLDQVRQDVLRARISWISSQQAYATRMDSFKISMGLPPDARIELDRSELDRLALAAKTALEKSTLTAAMVDEKGSEATGAPTEPILPERQSGGLLELEPLKAVTLALSHRRDLRISQDRVNDAQRKVVVAADTLRSGLTLTGTAQWGERRGIGSADLPDAEFLTNRGLYSAGLLFDLPWERTLEQNAYRQSYIALERSVRNMQELEDQIKLQVRNALRTLLQARESFKIQDLAVELASQRVESAALFLQAGRAQVRDVLEAQDDLVSARNARTAALVDYRVAELDLQRDMGVIEVDHRGLWSEYRPEKTD